MTNQEAIDYLLDPIGKREQHDEAIALAISALQAQDTETRKICNTCKYNPPSKKWPCADCDMRDPADRWEPKDVPDTNVGDMISRQAAIEVIDAILPVEPMKNEYTQGITCGAALAIEYVKQLPSAQPERKTGHWIKTARWGRVYYCDQCRNYLDFDGVNAGRGSTNFCPNCGANMKGEQDD